MRAGVVPLLLAAVLALAGCSHLESMLITKKKVHRATSVMQYLYPDANYQALGTTAEISVPVNVGIAFVPEAKTGDWMRGAQRPEESPIGEKEKARLLELVRQHFSRYEFIGRIEPIPTAYLRDGGGFDNLAQAGNMFGVDVMVLLSYDQIQFNDAKMGSIAYWTVVGLYFVKGELNTTQTLLDAVVIDIKSRNMLFRAPGTSEVEGSATALEQTEAQREQAQSGFRIATADLVANLDRELMAFRERVKARQAPNVAVTYREGYSGGNLGAAGAALAVAAVMLARRRR